MNKYIPTFHNIEITGEISVAMEYTIEGVMFHVEWRGGGVATMTLEALMDGNPLIRLSGDYVYIGQYVAEIIGYKSPGILVIKRLGLTHEESILK